MCAAKQLGGYEQVIIVSGDAPLISSMTIERLRDFHQRSRSAMTLLSAHLENPTGYGRVIRAGAKSDEIKAIVEEKPCTPAQRKIREINSGFYAFSVKDLFDHIEKRSE